MKTTQGNMRRSLVNVDDFLDAHADRLAGVVDSGVRKRLRAGIQDLSGYVTDQADHTVAARQETQSQYTLRAALVQEHMAPIARIAKLELPQTPELLPCRLPKLNISTEQLAVHARGMAKAAGRYTDVFVAAGLPADFVAQLEAATEALLKSLNNRDQRLGKAGSATTGLRTKLTESRKIVNVLDVLVKKAFKGDAVLLRNWSLAKRVTKTAVQSTPVASTPVLTVSTPSVPATEPAPSAVAAA